MQLPRVFIFLILFWFVSLNICRARKVRGKRNPTAVSDEIYDCVIKIANGKPLPPVKERTSAERSAYVRYWRAKGEITVQKEKGKDVLHYRGRRMLRLSEVDKLVAEEFERTKGSGARKLVSNLRHTFVGLGRAKVQNILNSDTLHYRKNAKFLNKATLKPIRAQDVQTRHQVDLMDMGKGGTVPLNKKSYRYVLSVMDVFSRFVWLRAVREKSSKVISEELQNIYLEHGPPRVVQSDQGGEFKGAVKRLCVRMNIKLIYSRPFHPQSQGKVERSHRSLR